MALGFCLTLAAQKKTSEISVYGGYKSYTKTGTAYPYPFSSGFGMGAEAKYYIADRVFGAADLFGATDDGTEATKKDELGSERILTSYRRDYGLTAGIGYDFLKTTIFTAYLQASAGVGAVTGQIDNIIPKPGSSGSLASISISHLSYLLAPAAGIDVSLSKHWKIGAEYTFHYLGDFDCSHALNAKITYVVL